MREHDDEVFEGIDAPRRMPPGLRSRIEDQLAVVPLADLLDDPALLLADIDGPRPLPSLTRMRLARMLTMGSTTLAYSRASPVPRRRFGSGWAAAAVAIALAVVSSFAVVPERRVVGEGVFLAGPRSIEDRLFTDIYRLPVDEAGVGNPGFEEPAPPPIEATPVDDIALPIAAPGPDPAPPFAHSDDAGQFGAAAGSPFRIRVLPGDAEAGAGLNAYVKLYNETAGSRARRLEVVGRDEAADVTVNLSGAPHEPSDEILIETLLAPDRLLRGNVFGFAGAVDRQAALLVDAVYPNPAPPGTTAVIYREPSGVLSKEVPEAMTEALEAKGVTVVHEEITQLVTPALYADAVFLSLEYPNAKRVADAYGSTKIPKGLNGVGTLAESSAVAGLPPGTRFISPYAFPRTNEAEAVKKGTGLPAGARVYHGWITAKTLAVAVWEDDPKTPEELRAALEGMSGYANGFAPVYTFRPGTTSVQPEGALFAIEAGEARQTEDFRPLRTPANTRTR